MMRLEEFKQALAKSKVQPGDILTKDGNRFLALFPLQLGISWWLVPVLPFKEPLHNRQVKLPEGVADVSMLCTVPEELVFSMDRFTKIPEELRAFIAQVHLDSIIGQVSSIVKERKELVGGPMTHLTEEQIQELDAAQKKIEQTLNLNKEV